MQAPEKQLFSSKLLYCAPFDPEKPEDFTVESMPERFGEIGDRFAEIDDVHHSLEPLLEMYERDEAEGVGGDMPYPPDYPKMPGEPKRVQPSRDRDRKK